MPGRSADWRWARRALLSVPVTLALAACASSPHSAPPSPPPTGATGSPATASAAPSATATGTGAQNLVASSNLKSALLAAFAGDKGLPQNDLTGPLPGTLYYGISASGEYWAVAHFGLTSSAPFQAQVDMQDGGDIGVFSRQGDQAWAVRLGGEPFPCPGELPADLMQVWGLTSPGACSAT